MEQQRTSTLREEWRVLPNEVWYQIFLTVGYKGTSVSRRVCKEWNRMCGDESLWKEFANLIHSERKNRYYYLGSNNYLLAKNLEEIKFPKGVKPSWFEYCKILSKPPPAAPWRKRLLKIVVLGDSGAGKTSLHTRYVNGKFTGIYKATIGADFQSKEIELDPDRIVALQIWDTAGPERFASLSVAFYRGTDGVLLAVDLTDDPKEIISSLDRWRREFIYSTGVEHTPFIVVGTKLDLVDRADEEQIEKEKLIKDWCSKHDYLFFVTSSKTGENIDESFEELAKISVAAQLSGQDPYPFPMPACMMLPPEPKNRCYCG